MHGRLRATGESPREGSLFACDRGTQGINRWWRAGTLAIESSGARDSRGGRDPRASSPTSGSVIASGLCSPAGAPVELYAQAGKQARDILQKASVSLIFDSDPEHLLQGTASHHQFLLSLLLSQRP